MAEKLTAAQKAADEEARLAKALEVSHKAGEALVNLFDETSTVFKRAKSITSWLGKGADRKLIAQALSEARATKAYPDASPEDIRFYASTKPSKGGVEVAAATIAAYANSWASVEAAGLIPTEETVSMAFKVYSKGRTAEPRKEMEKRISVAIEAQEIDQEAGARLYVTECREILTGRKSAEPREGRPEGNSRKAPIVDLGEFAEGIESGSVPVSLEGAIHTIEAILAQNWDESERAELAAVLAQGIETLAAEPVEV